MMGGCFAQDETSQTVDTYWVADGLRLDSVMQNVSVADAFYSGGDSANDEMMITYQADNYGMSYLVTGIRSSEGTSNRIGQVIFSGSGKVSVLGQQNGNTSNWSEPLGEKFTWWARGGKYKRGGEVGDLYVYNLEDSEPRMFRVGSALKTQNRIIYNVLYRNDRTGWKMQWQPMAGMTGTAFFEPTTATLAEQ